MSLKTSAYKTLNKGPLRPLIGLAASAFSTGKGDRAWITYDSPSGNWKKRTRGGSTLMPYPRGMSAEQCRDFARDVFLRHYNVQRGDVIFDIGAGIGTETLPFCTMVGDTGKVVAVEAHPSTFATLERLCQLNGVENAELIQAAVMDSDEPVMISNLPPELSIENRVGTGDIQVPGITISQLVANCGLDHIDFLKMNIEGAEVAALRGARNALPLVRNAAIGCHDFLADETGDDSYRTKQEVRVLLEEAGFTVTTREDDPRPWAAHYLFARRE